MKPRSRFAQTVLNHSITDDMAVFLLTKPEARLTGATCASSRTCRRPVWGDGRVDGEWHGLCSFCWHEWNAFHGSYTTLRANPAAANLSLDNIRERLTFGAELPDHSAHDMRASLCPETPPPGW